MSGRVGIPSDLDKLMSSFLFSTILAFADRYLDEQTDRHAGIEASWIGKLEWLHEKGGQDRLRTAPSEVDRRITESLRPAPGLASISVP